MSLRLAREPVNSAAGLEATELQRAGPQGPSKRAD